MKGVILWTGCEQGGQEHINILELWLFPDGTLNVLAITGGDKSREHVFPVALEQLESVINGKSLEFVQGFASLRLELRDTRIVAQCEISGTISEQTVALADFTDFIERARDQLAIAV